MHDLLELAAVHALVEQTKLQILKGNDKNFGQLYANPLDNNW